MTMTTLHLGQVLGRARRSVVSRQSWRPESRVVEAFTLAVAPAAAFHACGTSNGSLGDTTNFAGDMGFTTIKRPARLLAPRST